MGPARTDWERAATTVSRERNRAPGDRPPSVRVKLAASSAFQPGVLTLSVDLHREVSANEPREQELHSLPTLY